MSITEQDIKALQEKIYPILGKKAWGVHRLFGSYIRLEFGEPQTYESEFLGEISHGEWMILIKGCEWRLQSSDEVIVGSEDPHEKMDPGLQRLEGATIKSIEIQKPSMLTTITFDKGLILRLFPIYTEGDTENWALFTPDRHILIIGPGSQWRYKRSDTPCKPR